MAVPAIYERAEKAMVGPTERVNDLAEAPLLEEDRSTTAAIRGERPDYATGGVVP